MEVTTIAGGVILVVLIIAVYCYYKFAVPKDSDKNAASEFIKGYSNVFEKTIEKIIGEIDITQYHTVEEFESDIFAIAYDECWDYTSGAIQEALSNSTIGSLVAKCITKENVETIVSQIINSRYITKIDDIAADRISQANEEALEAEKKALEEADLYESGEKEVDEYIDPKDDEEEMNGTLNPPTDGEGAYSPDDNSQEIVGDVSTTTLNLDSGDDGSPDEE
jgi:hypothetical protein